MYKITLAAAVMLCACSPLKKIEQTTHTDSVSTCDDLTNLIRDETEQRFGTLHQTVVEFYPPGKVTLSSDLADTLLSILPTSKIPAHQPVKRIIYTETSARVDKATLTDSISRSRINTAARRDTTVQIEEKPSGGVVCIKWATALSALLLLIFLFIKFR